MEVLGVINYAPAVKGQPLPYGGSGAMPKYKYTTLDM